MVSYICIIITLILGILSYKRDQILFSPTVSFCLLYTLIFVFATSGWYGMYQAPDSAYLLITLGVVCFVVGANSRRRYSLSTAFYKVGKIYDNADLLYERRYWLMLIICLAVLTVSASMIALFILSGGTIGDVYVVAAASTDGAENELTKGSLQILLESYVAYPLLYLLVPASLVEFFSTYKRRYLVVAIALALLRVALDARRTYLSAFILMVVVCFFMHRKDLRFFSQEMLAKFKSFKKYILWIVLFFGYVFVFVSSQRSIAQSGEDQSSTLRTLIHYYGASVQFFGDCVRTTNIDYTFGVSSLRGFFAPIFGVLKLIGIDPPYLLDNANTYLTMLHAHILQISPDKDYNSFATCFFQFYCDGGVFGIIILSFIFGYYAQYLFERMVVFGSKRAEVAYVFFYANILMLSFVNMETVLALNFWPLVLVNLLYPKYKRKNI